MSNEQRAVPPLIPGSANYNDLFTTKLKAENIIGAGPSGINGSVQFNNNGSFGSDSTFTFNSTTGSLSVGTCTLGPTAIGFFGSSAPKQVVTNDLNSVIAALQAYGLIV